MKRLHYSWILVVAAAASLGLMALSQNTFGVFLVPLTEQFDWKTGVVSGAFSVSVLLMGLLGIVSGGLSDKYGPRPLVAAGGLLMGTGLLIVSAADSLWQIYLGWGVFMGLAGSCILTPVMSVIPKWFDEKKGLILGIATAGMGVCGIIFPLLAQWLISGDGWRHSAFVLGLIAFVAIPLAYFMKKRPKRTDSGGSDASVAGLDNPPVGVSSGFSFKEAIRSGRFWNVTPIHACFLFSMQAIMAHVVSYAVNMGITAIVAASIMSVLSGSTVIGNLSMGFISDKTGGKLAFTASLMLALAALVWLLFSQELWMFYLFAVLFGLGVGGSNPLATVVVAELFGVKSLGVIVGGVMVIGTIGGALGATLTGTIFDVTGSYTSAFVICIVLTTLAVVLSLTLLRYKDNQPRYSLAN